LDVVTYRREVDESACEGEPTIANSEGEPTIVNEEAANRPEANN
jgi:hypothetical protein